MRGHTPAISFATHGAPLVTGPDEPLQAIERPAAPSLNQMISPRILKPSTVMKCEM